MFAALDYKIESLLVTSAIASVRQGDVLPFSVQVHTSGAEAGTHVVQIQMTAPDGKPANMYAARVLAKGGNYTGRIPLSLDEKTGDWTISALDVVSGISAHATVKLVGDN